MNCAKLLNDENFDALKWDKRHMIILFNDEIFATVWLSHFFQSLSLGCTSL